MFHQGRPSQVSAERTTTRPISTTPSTSKPSLKILTPTEASTSILSKQRRARPTSPHLNIYRWSVTMYTGAMNRITGSILSGSLYIFGSLYLIGPYIGLEITSAGMAATFATWPVAAKLATKMVVAFPFVFHSLNGVRHLTWDTGTMLGNANVNKSGWTVIGLSVAVTVALALY